MEGLTMARKQYSWLVLTNVDPFPVFISHVNCQAIRPDTGKPAYMDGPFYDAGGKTYHADEPKTRVWAEGVVAYWAQRGFRFTLATEVR
jgi:hypothetical protein